MLDVPGVFGGRFMAAAGYAGASCLPLQMAENLPYIQPAHILIVINEGRWGGGLSLESVPQRLEEKRQVVFKSAPASKRLADFIHVFTGVALAVAGDSPGQEENNGGDDCPYHYPLNDFRHYGRHIHGVFRLQILREGAARFFRLDGLITSEKTHKPL